MKARMDYRNASPEGAKALGALHAFVHRCGLEPSLLELVKLRALYRYAYEGTARRR
jgi:hypothetical protein